MSLAQIYNAISGDVITAARWNNEFGNIYSNGTDVAFPVTKTVSFAGFTITLDAVGNTTLISNSSAGLLFIPGSKLGTPGINGSGFNIAPQTFTDNATAVSGVAAVWNFVALRQPTLMATNTGVATTDAATLFIEGAPLPGTNETITHAWALLIGSGNTKLQGQLTVTDLVTLQTSDTRTSTVTNPLIVSAPTSGSPTAGIGTGLKLQAQTTAETPADVGQLQFVTSNVGAGVVATFMEILLRIAGAALAPIYRFVATTRFRAIVTHSNSADRTYTLPDASGTLVAGGGNQGTVASGDMKTATGSAAVSAFDNTNTLTIVIADVALNDYSFFPSITTIVTAGAGTAYRGALSSILLADPGNTVGRIDIAAGVQDTASFNGTSAVTTMRWRYITASDTPTVWVISDPVTNKIVASWCADDMLPNDVPGISIHGLPPARKLTMEELASLPIPQSFIDAADKHIASNNLNTANQPYRALQQYTGDTAPAAWILENCQVTSKGVFSATPTSAIMIDIANATPIS